MITDDNERKLYQTYAKTGKRNLIEASVDPSKSFSKFCALAGLDLSRIRPNYTPMDYTIVVEEAMEAAELEKVI